MSDYVKVSEYAQLRDVHERTIYRWVKNGDINARTIDGVLHIEVDNNSPKEDDIVASLKSENCQLRQDMEFLQRSLEQAQQTIANMHQERQEAQQRSDTIIMKLTMQFEQQTQLLEDLRHKQDARWYQRLFRR